MSPLGFGRGLGAWRSLASAPEWGSGGRWFESSRPDIRKGCHNNRLWQPFTLPLYWIVGKMQETLQETAQ